MLSVALVNIVLDGDYQFDGELPIGLASVGAFLRQHGYPVKYCQCLAERTEDAIEKAAETEADVYGFSLNMNNLGLVVKMVRKIKASGSKARFIGGGPFLLTSSTLIMSHEPDIDFMAMGEGEYIMLELLQALARGERSFGGIDGLVWRDKSGAVIQNAMRRPIPNLDDLPFPDRDFLESGGHDDRGDSIETARLSTSRGCVAHCTFCNVNFFSQDFKVKRWRGRSAEKVVDEIEMLVRDYKIKKVNFSDSSFDDPGNIGKRRSAAICNELLRREIKVSAKIYLRAETMKSAEDIELLRLYKRAGIDVVIVGVESGSDYELKFYEKMATLEDNRKMMGMLRDLDMFYCLIGFLMFGPNSTVETLRANIDFMHDVEMAHNINQVSNVLILIRGSKLFRMLEQEGRLIETNDVCGFPLYKMIDQRAAVMARLWQHVFPRYPLTLQIMFLQVKVGNLISRMLNPMNESALAHHKDGYEKFKENTRRLNQKMGEAHHGWFSYLLDSVIAGRTEEKLEKETAEFFNGAYASFLPEWKAHYDDFAGRLVKSGFGAAGLLFEPYFSAVVNTSMAAKVAVD